MKKFLNSKIGKKIYSELDEKQKCQLKNDYKLSEIFELNKINKIKNIIYASYLDDTQKIIHIKELFNTKIEEK